MAMVADLIAAYDLLEPKERLRLEEALYAVAPHLRLTPADAANNTELVQERLLASARS